MRMLATAGLAESDVTLVDLPRGQMSNGPVKGRADAISMWEPEEQKPSMRSVATRSSSRTNKLYRELFSLYSSTAVLNDSRRRRALVTLCPRALYRSGRDAGEARAASSVVSQATKHPIDQIPCSWGHHRFPMAVPSDMLDAMVEQEKWVAQKKGRAPQSREALAAFFDTSILDEARPK